MPAAHHLGDAKEGDMSKADGWIKGAWEWSRKSGAYHATIMKVAGNPGRPYVWSVYRLPRRDHLSEDGRYRAFKSGGAQTLSQAKGRANAAIAEIVG